MAQPGAGARAKRFKCNSFSRNVTLIKTNDEHTSFSDMRNLKTKSVIEFSSSMTQDNVRDKIQETFPYLKNKNFLCAVSKKVNNERKEFDFGGSHIWDGKTIREKINGNSNLYILEDIASFGKQDPTGTGSRRFTLKRSHDVMTTVNNESRIQTAGHSVGTMAQGSLVAQSGTPQNITSTLSGIRSKSLDLLLQTAAQKQGQNDGSEKIARKSSCPPKRSFVMNAEGNCARQFINKVIEGRNEDVGTSRSDFESQLSDSVGDRGMDSGIEASDSLRVDDDSSETDLETVFTPLPASSDLSNDPWLDIRDTASKQDLPLEVNPPTSSQTIFETGMQISARKETSSCGTADDIPALLSDLFGEIQGICPSFGSVKGGFQFNISLTVALPDEVKEGVAHFDGVPVTVDKVNPFTLSGIVPGSQRPGEVIVIITTDSGQDLGITFFEYVDEMEALLKQLVKDRFLQARYFAMLSTEFACGNVTSGSNVSKVQGLENVPDHDSSNLSKQQQSVEFLQLMVYKAAQTNVQEFMEMVFSTSAGQVVFNSYKDRTPLPEDIARANGHDELAQYLQDVYSRLSQDKNVCSRAIDWLELVEAVQKQSSATDESTVRVDQSDEDDAGSSDYTANVETSSCTSLDSDLSCPNISENKVTTQDESPVGLDESDEDDDNSSDYVADAETSSCGSSNDDTGWPEISENKVLETANPVARVDEQQPMAELQEQSRVNSMLAQKNALVKAFIEKMERRNLDNSADSKVVAKLMKTEGKASTIQEDMTAEPARDPTQERMDWGFSSPFLDEKRNAHSTSYSSDEDFEENQKRLRSYEKTNLYMVSFPGYRSMNTQLCESTGKETIHNFVKRIFQMPGNGRRKPQLEKMVFCNANGECLNVGLPVGVLSTEETYQCCFYNRNLRFYPSELCRLYAVNEYSSDWNLSYFLVLCSEGKIASGVSQFSKIAGAYTKIKVDFFSDETIFEALVRDNRFKEEKLRSCEVTFGRTQILLSCKAVHIQGGDVEIVSVKEKNGKLPASVSLRPHPKPTVTAASIKPNQTKQEHASATCLASCLTQWPVDSSTPVTARSTFKRRENFALKQNRRSFQRTKNGWYVFTPEGSMTTASFYRTRSAPHTNIQRCPKTSQRSSTRSIEGHQCGGPVSFSRLCYTGLVGSPYGTLSNEQSSKGEPKHPLL